ncbi:hypothetical protein C8R44DRAFT_888062 [Mycena epipterygia]|nr:hypothetical protein C8R44DRAFT_888062 [Mycena epipterygia]
MISCNDLHLIGARLGDVLNVHDTPFGGMNMIFAGDFAQLAPTAGIALYGEKVMKDCDASMTPQQQEAALGKILWHQITTVVMLKENMRQTSQKADDQKLRTALTNMRYAACTPADIAFLKTRIGRSGRTQGFPRLTESQFRDVSIITALNAHKDYLNDAGAKRFARDTGQELTEFFSIDKLSTFTQAHQIKQRRRKAKDMAPSSNGISKSMQEDLWKAHPASTSKHIPAKLALCIGMPIMIRNNDATELCITKGQEATVAGWESSVGPFRQAVLDILFLKLISPPKDVNVPGLPMNVIPMTRTGNQLSCLLTNDTTVNINREQVQVLPNFGMTDYSWQVKTRIWNVVDLLRCRDHTSVYTCLSRSSTAEGTVIVKEPPNWTKITKGLPGWMRQEFRELDMLDEITELRYEGRLSEEVKGDVRNSVIRAYQISKGARYMSETWHPALQWEANEDPLKETEAGKPDIIESKKRSRPQDDKEQPRKKSRTTATSAARGTRAHPEGMIWDAVNYSCGYDSLFTILFHIWSENPLKWRNSFTPKTRWMKSLSEQFDQVKDHQRTLEDARDDVRADLHTLNPVCFPNGQRGISMEDLSEVMLGTQSFLGGKQKQCRTCNYRCPEQVPCFNEFHILKYDVDAGADRLETRIMNDLRETVWNETCPQCINQNVELYWEPRLVKNPDMVIIGLAASGSKENIEPEITFGVRGRQKILTLQGIVYYGYFHFTSRLVDSEGRIWFHDGIGTGRNTTNEGLLSTKRPGFLDDCRGLTTALLVYTD